MGIFDFLGPIGSAIGGIGSIIDVIGGRNDASDYNQAISENNAWNREFQEKGANWQTGNNDDILSWLNAINPYLFSGTDDTNNLNAAFAQYVNNARTGFANGYNDWAMGRSDDAVGAGRANAGQVGNIINYLMGGGDVDRLTGSGDLLTQMGINALGTVGEYDSAASSLLDDLLSKPYDLASMSRDYETAAMRGVDRAYQDASEQTARQALRSGQASAGRSQLEKMASQRAIDGADAMLNARIAAPSAYENLMTSHMGRNSGAISQLRGDSTAVRNVGQQGIAGGGSLYNSAGGLRTNQGQVAGNLSNTSTGNLLQALMYQPNFQDPSSGLLNPRAGWVNPVSTQVNPATQVTNPYSGYRPVQQQGQPMITAPWGTIANSIGNIAQGASQLFGGSSGSSSVPINTNPTYPSRTYESFGGY